MEGEKSGGIKSRERQGEEFIVHAIPVMLFIIVIHARLTFVFTMKGRREKG